MRRLLQVLCAVTAALLLSTGQATAAPAEFGTDWHDPVTAGPPVATPGTTSCTVTVAETAFRDYTPYKSTYAPPERCGDRWNKVVLRLQGSVAGRQYDRLGYLRIGGGGGGGGPPPPPPPPARPPPPPPKKKKVKQKTNKKKNKKKKT
ncbi:peptide-N4-asparagine amidase, partial [Streptomyces sp. NPDC049585]|uniref:peptide-N4-asparagine amidase n=1 Tax=Streptomyces sp. NPDC049585 TaxID=3155154 RepID=UPI00343F0BCB